ncbi:class I SAM-dependent methyltransferase [Archangium primigenium]|uniref:class I SAM-dependent methyltransferase n=1 Tax=[Archangium] primigenium TaxID=2792470 RepID=UPI001956CF81|nr:class I SAM-dependent methyltransferase [Archangium primigenium]MBM7118035.1 class I SAM-dependent methyltransferase [Archangium primigenium]
MKRMSLFEFEDFRWFPGGLRECLTLYIAALHRVLGTERILAPLLARALNAAATDRIVDLCSGGGGPLLPTTARLAADHGLRPSVTLTDLYPNTDAATRINAAGDSARVRYFPSPVDAGRVPDTLQGVRTVICGFHHMPPPVARRILQDAFEKRQALCVLEMSDNAHPRWLWWTAIPASILMVLLLTPFVRPLRLRQVLFTYALPVLPLIIAWDGAVSNARTYTEEDLRELLVGLAAPDYQWDIAHPRAPGAPATMLTLVGLPRTPRASAPVSR